MENHNQILHIRSNRCSKFQLQETILIFGANVKKTIFPVENRKNKH